MAPVYWSASFALIWDGFVAPVCAGEREHDQQREPPLGSTKANRGMGKPELIHRPPPTAVGDYLIIQSCDYFRVLKIS